MSTNESDDVSSTYESDEDVDCTCILTHGKETQHRKRDMTQDGDDTEQWLTAGEEAEIRNTDFETNPGDVYLFPKHRRTCFQEGMPRVKSLAHDTTAVTLVLPSPRNFLCGFSPIQVPKDLLFDIIVISPGTNALILTITNNFDQSVATKLYNISLARALTTTIRTDAFGSFTAVHGVLSISEFSSDESFQTKIRTLKHEASLTTIQNTTYLTAEKCRAVLHAVVSLVRHSSRRETEYDTGTHLTIPGAGLAETTLLSENEVKLFPRQMLNATERKFFLQLSKSGPVVLPYSMYDYIRAHHPEILTLISQEMEGGRNLVYAQTSLLRRFTGAGFVPPNVFCDIILMTSHMTFRILTFATSDYEEQIVHTYNHTIAQVFRQSDGSRCHTENKVIVLERSDEEMRLTHGDLSSEYEDLSNSWMRLVLSPSGYLGDPNSEDEMFPDVQDDITDDQCPVSRYRHPTMVCIMSWNIDGGSPCYTGTTISVNWSLDDEVRTDEQFNSGCDSNNPLSQLFYHNGSRPLDLSFSLQNSDTSSLVSKSLESKDVLVYSRSLS